MDGFLSRAVFHISVLFYLADYLINICKDRVICIRIFQSNVLKSKMAQIATKYDLAKRSQNELTCLLCACYIYFVLCLATRE